MGPFCKLIYRMTLVPLVSVPLPSAAIHSELISVLRSATCYLLPDTHECALH